MRLPELMGWMVLAVSAVAPSAAAPEVTPLADRAPSPSLGLAAPLEDLPHPCLLLTRDMAHQVLERVKTSRDARAAFEALKGSADAWLGKTPHFPDRGGQWWHWYTCKQCGARLVTKSPTLHVCPECGATYTGWPYDDVVLDTLHNDLARAIRDCGVMYVLTGAPDYAAKAREILLGYAARYLTYPLHDINGKPNKGGGHVGPQTLDESTWLIPVAQGFDCIRDALSAEDRRIIADKLLLPAAWLIHDGQWGIHNICCWMASAYGLVGLALGEPTLARDALAGPKGFQAQVQKGISQDGEWYEGAWGYHYYTMSALQPLAVAAHNVGLDLYSARYKSMYDAPLEFMAPGGALPAFNDSGPTSALGAGSCYEIAWARWGDPRHLIPVLAQGSRRSLEYLLSGAEVGQEPRFSLGSRLFPAAGYAVLRSGEVGDKGVDRHLPSNYLAFKYGPHGGGHGHPDKLSFVLYGKRTLLAEDPGCIAYGNPAHAGWFRQTLSHNTVLVNGKSQRPTTGALLFSALAEGAGFACAGCDDAYPGVRLRRAVALLGDRVVDVFWCQAEEESVFDWAYHNRGSLETSLSLAPLDPAPAGDGYGWAKEWRAAAAKQAWRVVWRQPAGPVLTLVQAPARGEREVLAAVGMGNPTKVKNPFVVSRVRGKSALYCSALQITEREPAGDLSIRELAVEAGGAQADPAVAVEVIGGGVRDVLLLNPAGGPMRAGGLGLRGPGAALHFEAGKPARILLAGDSELTGSGAPAAP